MIDLLFSDPAIFLLTSLGLAVTTLSIVRDARSQHERTRAEGVRVEV